MRVADGHGGNWTKGFVVADDYENADVLTWVNRIKRVKERCVDLLGDQGWRWRVLRTSNAYTFRDPSPPPQWPNSSKSEKPTGTENPDLSSDLLAALDRLKEAFEQEPRRRRELEAR